MKFENSSYSGDIANLEITVLKCC